jgi:hypothetical protein
VTKRNNIVKLSQSKQTKFQWFRDLSQIIIENMDETKHKHKHKYKHKHVRTLCNDVKKSQKYNFEIKNTLRT